MTNASTYVYKSLTEYMELYPKGQDVIAEQHMDGIWMNDKQVVFVGNNAKGVANYRPDFSKSFIYYDLGEDAFVQYEKDYEPVVEIKVKDKSVTFYGQTNERSMAVARKFGKCEGNVKGYILYDDTRPRINLIMEPVTS